MFSFTSGCAFLCKFGLVYEDLQFEQNFKPEWNYNITSMKTIETHQKTWVTVI